MYKKVVAGLLMCFAVISLGKFFTHEQIIGFELPDSNGYYDISCCFDNRKRQVGKCYDR